MSGPKPKTFEQNYERFKKSAKEEKKFGKQLGGKALPRSGGLSWSADDKTTAGADIRSDDLWIEHKRCERDTGSLGVKRAWLKKVTEGANRVNKIPALGVTWESPQGHAERWLMIPLEVAERIIGKIREDG